MERFRQGVGMFEPGVREGGRQHGREGVSSVGTLGGCGEEQEELHGGQHHLHPEPRSGKELAAASKLLSVRRENGNNQSNHITLNFLIYLVHVRQYLRRTETTD